jgi:hypothetical protein
MTTAATATATDVITYQLAYRSTMQVSLCPACAERDDHGRGALGPVSHGLHAGRCQGLMHGVPAITDDQISALEVEAGAAGDSAQVDFCRAALEGDAAARAKCAQAIANATAQA